MLYFFIQYIYFKYNGYYITRQKNMQMKYEYYQEVPNKSAKYVAR